jgi:hypothetical protein
MKAAVVPLLCVLFLIACSSGRLPAVADADQLVKDCDALSKNNVGTDIPPDQWPASIKALKPVAVENDPNGIRIATYAETGIGSYGYLVSHTKPDNTEHLVFSQTEYANIYRFDLKP